MRGLYYYTYPFKVCGNYSDISSSMILVIYVFSLTFWDILTRDLSILLVSSKKLLVSLIVSTVFLFPLHCSLILYLSFPSVYLLFLLVYSAGSLDIDFRIFFISNMSF